MPLTKVLITVKTYPTISTKYEELVCTAGFKEDGNWIRIYPVQFRKKAYDEQYSKYQWIEIDLVKNTGDFRPESYRPVSHDTEIRIINEIEADGGSWDARRKLVLNKVYTNLTTLIAEAKDRSICTSLAVFKPTEIVDVKIKASTREWSKEKLATLQQLSIFESVKTDRPQVVKKLPYEFSYVFKDDSGKQATLMIEDWELGQLYWNCLRRHEGDETKACADVKYKYFNDFAKTKDLHLYLGTAQTYHLVSPNPFLVIGTFHPKFPKVNPQGSLF
ncbi:MAG: hypothetical protein KF741_13180 [Ferruginibacter sp.]|nr:hypothetical protein [Bacteroidota bacterium]MBX2920190.1 hypothetical protein [Ferruginibacter sp.]